MHYAIRLRAAAIVVLAPWPAPPELSATLDFATWLSFRLYSPLKPLTLGDIYQSNFTYEYHHSARMHKPDKWAELGKARRDAVPALSARSFIESSEDASLPASAIYSSSSSSHSTTDSQVRFNKPLDGS